MPFNGSGVFVYTATTVTPAVSTTTISSSDFNTFTADVSTALSLCLTEDGQNVATANLPMATFRHTGVGDGAALTDYASANQVVDGALTYGGASAAGTDTYAVNLTINPGAYVAGNRWTLLADVANTGACTINISSNGAKNVKMQDGNDPPTNYIIANAVIDVLYDGTNLVLMGVPSVGVNLASAQTMTNKTLTSATLTTPVLNTSISGTAFLDEDNMASDSAVKVASQQSIKAYVDAAAPAVAPTLGTPVASTSGTTIDFTSIPSGVKRITVSYQGVSTDGNSDLELRIGDSGGVEATGYNQGGSQLQAAAVASVYGSTGFALNTIANAAALSYGVAILTLLDSTNFIWSCSANGYGTNIEAVNVCGGTKALTAALDRIQVTTVAADTFDAGSINILYEG